MSFSIKIKELFQNIEESKIYLTPLKLKFDEENNKWDAAICAGYIRDLNEVYIKYNTNHHIDYDNFHKANELYNKFVKFKNTWLKYALEFHEKR